MSDRQRLEVMEDGMRVAVVDGPFDHAVREAARYAALYAQDGGNITIRHIPARAKRKLTSAERKVFVPLPEPPAR